MRAVCVSYLALYSHFCQAATDTNLDSKDKGLAAKLASSAFFLNLGLMYDALQELSDLSQSLQADSLNLNKTNLIAKQLEIFASPKTDDGGH